jgi:hypothetical protein
MLTTAGEKKVSRVYHCTERFPPTRKDPHRELVTCSAAKRKSVHDVRMKGTGGLALPTSPRGGD